MPLKPTDNITLGIVDYPVVDMLRGVEVEYIIISFVHRYFHVITLIRTAVFVYKTTA